jgi:hypothetical protein
MEYNYLDLSATGFNATYGTSSRRLENQPTSTQFITGGSAQTIPLVEHM